MIEIPLTQGKVALIDDADLELVSSYKWCATFVTGGYFYAVARGKDRKTVYMHRLLTNAPRGKVVDHIDGDGLNNQRANLRVCTNAENLRNHTDKRRNNTSGYVGVSWYSRNHKWLAQIKLDGRNIYLGLHETARLAALARDRAAIELHGEYAYLNFPQIQEGD